MTEQIMPDVPQYAISVQPDQAGQLWMGLQITSTSMNVTAFLCRSDNYEEVARILHKNILDAGRGMRQEERRAAAGLVLANGKGDVDAAVSTQRRIERGPRSAG